MLAILLTYVVPVLSFIYVGAVYAKSRSVTSALVSGTITSIVAGSASGLILRFMSSFVNINDTGSLVAGVVLVVFYIAMYLLAYRFRLAWIGRTASKSLPETPTKPSVRVRAGRVIAVLGAVLYFQFIILGFVASIMPEVAFTLGISFAFGYSMLAASAGGTLLTMFGTLLSIDYSFLNKKTQGPSTLWPDMGSEKV